MIKQNNQERLSAKKILILNDQGGGRDERKH